MTTNTTTTDNALAEWMRLAAQLTGADQSAADALNAAGSALGALYSQAEAAGDEPAMSAISTAWQAAQQKRLIVQHMDAAVSSAAAVMRELVRQRRDALQELESLTDALERADTLDSRLADFVRAVEEESIIYAEEAVFEQVADNIVDDMRSEIFDTLRSATGIDYKTLQPFIRFLFNGGDLTSIQIGLFRALVAAFQQEEAARV